MTPEQVTEFLNKEMKLETLNKMDLIDKMRFELALYHWYQITKTNIERSALEQPE